MDWGRVGLGLATGGLSEGYGFRPAYQAVGGVDPVQQYMNALDRSRNEFRGVDPTGMQQQQANEADAFAMGNEQQYWRTNQGMDSLQSQLERLARGEDSYSAEQLRQGLAQNVANQQAMAASARPGMQPMAARTAMIQANRAGTGLAGQQALAGIQERQAAANNLGNFLTTRSGQQGQFAINSRGNAINAQDNIERARTARYQGLLGVPTQTEMVTNQLSDLAKAIFKMKNGG